MNSRSIVLGTLFYFSVTCVALVRLIIKNIQYSTWYFH